MTLCQLHNGAQCHCQPDEGVFCVYEDALQKDVRNTCQWADSGDGYWHTECGGKWTFIEDTPAENGMKFCCYCGKRLQQLFPPSSGATT
jgi:hypothetical protein